MSKKPSHHFIKDAPAIPVNFSNMHQRPISDAPHLHMVSLLTVLSPTMSTTYGSLVPVRLFPGRSEADSRVIFNWPEYSSLTKLLVGRNTNSETRLIGPVYKNG
jgi:hypothetical protein